MGWHARDWTEHGMIPTWTIELAWNPLTDGNHTMEVAAHFTSYWIQSDPHRRRYTMVRFGVGGKEIGPPFRVDMPVQPPSALLLSWPSDPPPCQHLLSPRPPEIRAVRADRPADELDHRDGAEVEQIDDLVAASCVDQAMRGEIRRIAGWP